MARARVNAFDATLASIENYSREPLPTAVLWSGGISFAGVLAFMDATPSDAQVAHAHPHD